MSKRYLFIIIIGFILLTIYTTMAQRVVAVQTIEFEKSELWYSCNYIHRSSDRDLALKTPKLVKVNEKAFEGISKNLENPIRRNNCYRFTFFAKRDSQYIVKQNEPRLEKQKIELLIFGAQAHCGYEELLADPFELSSTRWKKYTITLKAQKFDWTHINIYAVSENNEISRSVVLINQQGEIEEVQCTPRVKPVTETENLVNTYFKYNPASTLSFGGVLMMYEISPQSIDVFRKNGEIVQDEKVRKDIARNPTLDNILNEFRGIDYLFLVLQKRKYRKKRLNLISYLKTKYPDIFKQSKIMLYEELPQYKFRTSDKPKGDLLVVETVRVET